MARQRRDSDKERFWRDVLARHRVSGLSARAFCRRDGLSEASFYSWRRTIAERDAGSGPDQLADRSRTGSKPQVKRDHCPAAPTFVPAVVIGGAQREDWITIELRGGRVLRLPEAMPAEQMADLIVTLEARTAG